MNIKGLKTHVVQGKAQIRAISSPLRLEIIGQFAMGRVFSVKEIAEHMGRPASAVHYHIRVLEESGLLKRVGVRKDGRRPEAEYMLIADALAVPATSGQGGGGDNAVALKTMAAAFRMAERDMKAALSSGKARSTGKYRNTIGIRMHCRLSRKELAELNKHLDAVLKMLLAAHKQHDPQDDDEFLSLTLALLPLPDRAAKP